MARGLFVEGAIIGREQIFGERQFCHHLLHLDPEAPTHAFAVLRQPVGRLKTHGMFGRCHRKNSLKPSRARLPQSAHGKNWGRHAADARSAGSVQPTPSCRAIAFMALARSISRAVTPPASWVANTTSTVL